MKFKHNLPANMHDFNYFAEPEMTSDMYEESNEDNFGVGALMPQDMPSYMILTETESYGV